MKFQISQVMGTAGFGHRWTRINTDFSHAKAAKCAKTKTIGCVSIGTYSIPLRPWRPLREDFVRENLPKGFDYGLKRTKNVRKQGVL